MSTTTPNMGLTKPDPDGSVGTWDTELNASLDLTDAHDHSPGKGVKVTPAGININTDLSFAGFGATALKVVDLAAVLASEVTGYPTALFVNSTDNELYWRTSGGVNVKLTSGNSLNAALLGGFTGDYGSGGSTASFTSGTSIYNFLRAANHRAFIDCSDIRLFQGTAGITNAVKIRSPNGLAASYDWIFPTALPAASESLSISSAGQVIAGYRQSPKVRHIPATAGAFLGGSTGTFNGTNAFAQWTGTTERLWVPIELLEGERLLAVAARVREVAAGDELRMRIFRLDHTGASTTAVQLGTDQFNNSLLLQTLTQSGLSEQAGTTHLTYVAEFRLATSSGGAEVHGVLVTTDFP